MMSKESSKRKRRRRLNRRPAMSSMMAPGAFATEDGKRRMAWLMLAVHGYRVGRRCDDAEALKHSSALSEFIPNRHQHGCRECAPCQAIAYAVSQWDSEEGEHAIAAACSLKFQEAVRTSTDEMCGTTGIVVSRSAELGFNHAPRVR